MGLRVTYKEAVSFEEVTSPVNEGYPVICAIDTTDLPYVGESVPHVVVIIAIDSDEVIFNDPLQEAGPQRLSIDSFMIAWVEIYCQYAIIRPR